MIKKINLSKLTEGGDQELDAFLEGGAKGDKGDKDAASKQKAKHVEFSSDESDGAASKKKAKPAAESSSDESDESDPESEQEDVTDTASVVSSRSAKSSTLTIDMLAGDPLFVVLSHFLMCRDEEGDNIVTVLKKISVSLEKIANAKAPTTA
jgi:hypothetical protein